MSFRLRVRLTGFDEAIRWGQEAKRRLPEDAAMVLATHVDAIWATARELAPYKTGYLRQSIKKLPMGPLHWVIIALAHYAYWWETGFIGRDGIFRQRPFLTPALYQHLPGLVKEMATILNREPMVTVTGGKTE